MRVRINAAGNDQLPRGIDDLISFHVELRADHGNHFILDQYIGFVIVNCRDDAAITNQHLQLENPSRGGGDHNPAAVNLMSVRSTAITASTPKSAMHPVDSARRP